MASLVDFDLTQDDPVEVEFDEKASISVGLIQGIVS
jgi:hypothetical protein